MDRLDLLVRESLQTDAGKLPMPDDLWRRIHPLLKSASQGLPQSTGTQTPAN